MTQPKRGTTPQEAPQEPQEAPHMPEPGKHNPAVNDLLAFAKWVKAERESILEKTTANRDMLRNYAKLGLLSPEQEKAIEAFYPKPKRGEKDQTTEPAAA